MHDVRPLFLKYLYLRDTLRIDRERDREGVAIPSISEIIDSDIYIYMLSHVYLSRRTQVIVIYEARMWVQLHALNRSRAERGEGSVGRGFSSPY